MHQHPRPPPRSSSAASNPSTNPERTNNSRDPPPQRTRSSVDLASYTERAGGSGSERARAESVAAASGQDKEMTKLNQIVQHFHTKAALMICSARANLPQVSLKNGDVKQDRWFNIVLDDTDVLLDDLQEWKEWKRSDVSDRPPPLVIEAYLDTAHLRENQALVIVDEDGKRYDVSDALAGSADSSPRPPNKAGGKFYEVVLERWTIELGDAPGHSTAELHDQLPNVYKKGVVLFRSLYTFLRFLPAWKLHRRLSRQPGNHQALRLKYRITRGRSLPHGQKDSLSTPLCPSELSDTTDSSSTDNVLDHHRFRPLACPAGLLSCRVDYRRLQDFAAVDAEALLSSRFLGLDEGLPTLAAGRSLPGGRTQQQATSSPQREQRAKTQYGSAGETRTTTSTTKETRPRSLLGAYSSLGTFHATGRRESPITALRRETNNEEDEDMAGDPGRWDVYPSSKRPSPFKAGSLGDNPPLPPRTRELLHETSKELNVMNEPLSPPTRGMTVGSFKQNIKDDKEALRDIGRPRKSSSASNSKRTSLNTPQLPQQALRPPPNPTTENAIVSSGSSSPRPAPFTKYSSSFANRPKRPLSTTSPAGRSGESGDSSARGSGVSTSKEDDDMQGIADLIKLTESTGVKDHALMRPPTSPARTVDLGKYRGMRDPSANLADDMASSSLVQASSTPPSRRLSNVPGLSTSSSPSRPQYMSHVPIVRSRLSGATPEEEGTEEEEEEPLLFAMGGY